MTSFGILMSLSYLGLMSAVTSMTLVIQLVERIKVNETANLKIALKKMF